mmetsp:Transcript_33322/g.24472  ORF Transcript_33322/g.24472 Transcript_33322/m.24472 type:complete len:88 (+) Transcript_33322:752-1015(+)
MKEDELCLKTIELFVKVLGVVCQHLVLFCGAWKGVFLNGGSINYLSNFIYERRALFLEEFLKHKERSELLRHVPIVIFRQNPTIPGL